MSNEIKEFTGQYVQSNNGDIFKVLEDHFLKISPWKIGDDRRIKEMDLSKCKILTYKNACMIVNTQFANTKEEWDYKGDHYVADVIPDMSYEMYAGFLKLLPDHEFLKSSEETLKNVDNGSVEVEDNDSKIKLKIVKHKGKIYYCLILNEFLPRVRMYDLFGKFLQWANIKNVKPIWSQNKKRFI